MLCIKHHNRNYLNIFIVGHQAWDEIYARSVMNREVAHELDCLTWMQKEVPTSLAVKLSRVIAKSIFFHPAR